MKHVSEDQIIYSPSHPVPTYTPSSPPPPAHPFQPPQKAHAAAACDCHTRVIFIIIMVDPSKRTTPKTKFCAAGRWIDGSASRTSIFLVALLFQASALRRQEHSHYKTRPAYRNNVHFKSNREVDGVGQGAE